MLKTSLLFKKFTNFTGKNAKFSGCCFYRNTNILITEIFKSALVYL